MKAGIFETIVKHQSVVYFEIYLFFPVLKDLHGIGILCTSRGKNKLEHIREQSAAQSTRIVLKKVIIMNSIKSIEEYTSFETDMINLSKLDDFNALKVLTKK